MLLTEQKPTQWRIGKGAVQKCRGRFAFSSQQMAVSTEAILWSLADLMTLLLIFFVMLYTDAARRPLQEAGQFLSASVVTQETQDTARATVAEVSEAQERPDQLADPGDFRQPEAYHPMASLSQKPLWDEELNRQVINTLADSFSDDFYVRWEDRQPVIVLGERITFDVGQAVLLAEAREALQRVARLITRFDNYQVVVTGHTDDLPIHTNAFPSNWELSAGRAASVAKALVDNGVTSSRLIIQGQAQFKPLLSNANESNRRANRRVEISLITP